MIPKIQTRLHNPPIIGNCFAAVIASVLEMEVEEVIQIQEHYEEEKWFGKLNTWLAKRGWRVRVISKSEAKRLKNKYYFVTGLSPVYPGEYHICIFKNGEMVHDPHPEGRGITTKEEYSILEKI